MLKAKIKYHEFGKIWLKTVQDTVSKLYFDNYGGGGYAVRDAEGQEINTINIGSVFTGKPIRFSCFGLYEILNFIHHDQSITKEQLETILSDFVLFEYKDKYKQLWVVPVESKHCQVVLVCRVN